MPTNGIFSSIQPNGGSFNINNGVLSVTGVVDGFIDDAPLTQLSFIDGTIDSGVAGGGQRVVLFSSITAANYGQVEYTSTPVPEPLTILGTVTAMGFGVKFKRKLAKAKKDKI